MFAGLFQCVNKSLQRFVCHGAKVSGELYSWQLAILGLRWGSIGGINIRVLINLRKLGILTMAICFSRIFIIQNSGLIMEQLILDVKNKNKLNFLVELVKHLDFVEVASPVKHTAKEKKF